MTEQPSLIAGEALDDLTRTFGRMKTTPAADGMLHVELRADDATMAPFVRALLRLEAELLLADADQLTVENMKTLRTPPQRAADAFVEMARRIGEAVTHPSDP